MRCCRPSSWGISTWRPERRPPSFLLCPARRQSLGVARMFKFPQNIEEVWTLRWPFVIALVLALFIQCHGNWRFMGLFPKDLDTWADSNRRYVAVIAVIFTVLGTPCCASGAAMGIGL